MYRGYIKLYRKIQDNHLWKKSKVKSQAEAWLDIIMEVQHREEPENVDIKMTPLICYQGDSLNSLKTWASRWGWTVNKVWRFLKLLQNRNMIQTKSETVTTRVSVVNYKIYHNSDNKIRTQIERKQNANRMPLETDKNDKKVKNVKNVNNKVVFPEKLSTPEFKKSWGDWTDHRREIKKPLTPTTIEKQLEMLNKHTLSEAIAMLNQSMTNGWTGIFEIKNGNNSRKTKELPYSGENESIVI